MRTDSHTAGLLQEALGLAQSATPFPWQLRLLDRMGAGSLPGALDIPTGLGKTSVMAIWLLARAAGANLPRRLVYVVDRRVVVDQATREAERLRSWLSEQPALLASLGLAERSLPISTLRGQHVDNREWLEDPGVPAIVIGTVDMIGSRLLFSGYGVSRKMRPYHAGLLGHDTLLVLDEAHLVPPFEALLQALAGRSGRLAGEAAVLRLLPPFRLVTLSATGRSRSEACFRIGEADRDHTVARQRLDAPKALRVEGPATRKELPARLVERAWELATQPSRVVIYANSRAACQEIKLLLEARANEEAPRKSKKGASERLIEVELLVGARRVRERQSAAARLEALGFVAGGAPPDRPTFLVATSAGEVGVDLDADHMVCDLAPWERMVQRLGRVNRRGARRAEVVVVPLEPEGKEREAEQALLEDRVRLLEELEGDGSPTAIQRLTERAEEDAPLRARLLRASSPAPLHPPLESATVEDWAMTSWPDHAGRPPVSPWLRGWIDEEPQTALVWRHADALPTWSASDSEGAHTAGRVPLSKGQRAGYFEATAPHLSEVLETETWRAVEWLAECAKRIEKERLNRAKTKQDDEESAEDDLPPSGCPLGVALGSDGSLHCDLPSSEDLSGANKSFKDDLFRAIRGRTLILDSLLGGLDESGLLDSSVKRRAVTAGDEEWLVSDADEPVVRYRVVRQRGEIDPPPGWWERLRLPARLGADEQVVEWLVVHKWRHEGANEDDRSAGPNQSLQDHEACAEACARDLAGRLELEEPYAGLLALAARLHDEGKRAERWQRAFHAPSGEAFAKTRGPIDFQLLDGYRHEFGSLPYVEADPGFAALSPEDQELVLHLVAAHHGFARPWIRWQSCDDAPPSSLEMRARDCALRFARAQERWGPWGLAWWEALLRAADQQASRANQAGTLALGVTS